LLWLHLGRPERYRTTCAKLIASAGDATSPMTAEALAWQCVLGPEAVTDTEAVIRLAEASLAGVSPDQRPPAPRRPGAALHRAGRPAESSPRLEEGIRLGDGQGLPQDWAFLAIAHQALGDPEAAHQWFRKLADRLPPTYWEGVELKLLQREAESLILGSRPATSPSAPSGPTKQATGDPGTKPEGESCAMGLPTSRTRPTLSMGVH